VGEPSAAQGGGDPELFVSLAVEPSFSPLPSTRVGLLATLPHYALVAGDVVSVPVVAATVGRALTTWTLEVAYDSRVLAFASASQSAAYLGLSTADDAEQGRLVVSCAGLRSGVGTVAVTGPEVGLL